MNGKKSKAIRALSRMHGDGITRYLDYTPCIYRSIEKDGVKKWIRMPGTPRKLDPSCTRYMYQKLKKVFSKTPRSRMS